VRINEPVVVAEVRSNREVLGRQSQTWPKLPGGWRIVSAHVSLVAANVEWPGIASSIAR
jgi:hypothetical protein